MSSSLTEDDVIKKRLLIEGDSGNEDRCINKLIRLFIKWSQQSSMSQQQTGEDEEMTNAHDMMITLLSHIEYGLMRNQLILEMNKLEQDNYNQLYKNIDSDISNARQDIIKYKQELQQARKIRKNRQEYDVLAKEILKYSDRQEMESTIERLNKQLDELKENKNVLNHKIDIRRKQFSIVLNSLSTLKSLIDNEQYDNEEDRVGRDESTEPPPPQAAVQQVEGVKGMVTDELVSDNDNDEDDDDVHSVNSDRQQKKQQQQSGKMETDD